MKKEIEVEQNDEGYRVVGILDGKTVKLQVIVF